LQNEKKPIKLCKVYCGNHDEMIVVLVCWLFGAFGKIEKTFFIRTKKNVSIKNYEKKNIKLHTLMEHIS
jgi:hypothetical protein